MENDGKIMENDGKMMENDGKMMENHGRWVGHSGPGDLDGILGYTWCILNQVLDCWTISQGVWCS